MILENNPLCNPLCNSCHYRNFDYQKQLSLKQNWANEKLYKWKEVLKEIRPAPEEERLGYRSKTWLRFHQGSFGTFKSVKREGKWEKEFISWDTCPLHKEFINKILTKLKEIELSDHLMGVWIGSSHLVFVSSKQDIQFYQKIDWARLFSLSISIWHHFNPQVGRHIFSKASINLVFGKRAEMDHPIRAFRQVANTLLKEARELGVTMLLRNNPKLILDLYCGTGELMNLLPKEVKWLGIELSKEAVNYAKKFGEAYAGKVEHRLTQKEILGKINDDYSLYLNPPRSGLSTDAKERILGLIKMREPKNIVYLSCSASRLANDLELFTDYKVEMLQPFDFFPQTEHFEILAILNR